MTTKDSQKVNTRIQKVFYDLDELYVRGPLGRSWWMGHGYVGLRIQNSRLLISDIWVEQRFRNAGHGGTMLKVILALADKRKVCLRIKAQPFDPKSSSRRSKAHLYKWYSKHGFQTVNHKSGLMERKFR